MKKYKKGISGWRAVGPGGYSLFLAVKGKEKNNGPDG